MAANFRTIEVYVPQYKFNEMEKKISVKQLSERHAALDTVFFENREYVITGASGTGTGVGWAEFRGNRVEDLEHYNGTLPALSYDDHYIESRLGCREIGYQGQIIQFGKRKLVCCEEYTFYPSELGKQASLF